MELISVIVDELGCTVCECQDMNETEIETMLQNHPEWRRSWLQI